MMNDNTIISEESKHMAPIGDTELYYPPTEEQAQSGFVPALVDEMLKHVVLGANLTDIANIVKLPPARIHHWYKINYCNFAYAVDYHMADFKRRLLAVMMKADAPVKIKAATFFLERKYREEYGKEIKIEHNHIMLDNIMNKVFDVALRHIHDPQVLKVFIEDLSAELSLIKAAEGMPENQKLIS